MPSFCRTDSERFHSCETQLQVIELHDVFVVGAKPNQPVGQSVGSIFNAKGDVLFVDPYRNKGALPVLSQEHAQGIMSRATNAVVFGEDVVAEFDDLIYGMSSYGAEFYHQWSEVLPRLLLAMEHAPANTPVLLEAQVLHEALNATRGLLPLPKKYAGPKPDSSYIVTARDHAIFRVKRLQLAWEVSRPGGAKGQAVEPWKSVSENCSWVMGLPAALLRTELESWPVLRPAPAEEAHGGNPTVKILVVHRAESNRRQVKNHRDLMNALEMRFPAHKYTITEFIGSEHSARESFGLFAASDLVIAPHGAALIFVHGMRPGSALLEITFKDRRRNSHLTYDFFRLLAVKLGVRYDATFSEGGFDIPLNPDVNDVVRTAERLMRTPAQ